MYANPNMWMQVVFCLQVYFGFIILPNFIFHFFSCCVFFLLYGLSMSQVKRSSIRKGMVMVSPKLMPQATWEFEAEILVLHHPTTISPRYQAMG